MKLFFETHIRFQEAGLKRGAVDNACWRVPKDTARLDAQAQWERAKMRNKYR